MNFENYMGKDEFEGAGFIFIAPNNHILVLEKPNGKHSFVGGHREGNETPKETAQRECKEEIGFIPEGKVIDFIKYKRSKTNTWGYSFPTRVEKEFIPKLSNEHISYKWISIKDLEKLQFSNAIKDLIPFLKNLI